MPIAQLAHLARKRMAGLTAYLVVWIVALLLMTVAGMTAHAQTVTLTASPASGVAPLDVSLTWSTAGFPAGATVSCSASGDWNGAKATSGTETVTGVTASATYSLTCSGGNLSARINWTPPTTFEDGTPIAGLSHFNIYSAPTAGGVTATGTAIRVDAPASTYTVTGLPLGQHCFGLTAVTSAGAASVLSNVSCKTVAAATASASASVTVSPRPNPPVIVTVELIAGMGWTPVYSITSTGKKGSLFGFVPANVPCIGAPVFEFRDAVFYEISRANVQWWGTTRLRVAAPCGSV